VISEERIGRGSPVKAGGETQDPPDFGGHEFPPVDENATAATFVNTNRGSVSQKGSFLVFPNVELKWDGDGNLIQDTFLSVTNDSSSDVRVKLYFVHGDCCLWSDRGITLTGHESTYWSAFDGLPKGVTPFTGLGDGIQDPDDHSGQGIRRLAGYVLLWAEDAEGIEICWNHLLGKATIVSYQHTSAWEYDAWAFKALGTGADGQPLQMPYGQLDLNGIEYEHVPGYLLLDFFAAGTMMEAPGLPNVEINTDVTLWPAVKDLRDD